MLRIMTLSIMTLSIMTLSTTTLSISYKEFNCTQPYRIIILILIMLRTMKLSLIALSTQTSIAKHFYAHNWHVITFRITIRTRILRIMGVILTLGRKITVRL